MPNFPFSFFKNAASGATPIPVDEVITFENLVNSGLSTNAQVNSSTYGTLLNGFQFLATATPHDPAISFKGDSSVTWPAWPSPLSVGGVVVPRTNNMAIVKNARTLNNEDAQWNFNTNTATKYVYGALFMWNAPVANQNPGPTSMDLLSIQPTGGTGERAEGTWFQVNYAGNSWSFEYETSLPSTLDLFGTVIQTGIVYLFEAIVDHVAGTITTAWWDTSTIPWNQVGGEGVTTTHVGSATSLALFELCPFNTATWNADPALFYFKDPFIALGANAVFPINATLGLRHPDNFVATVAGFTSVNLTWTAVSQASSYDIDQSTDGGVNWTSVSMALAATSKSVTGLTSNVNYVFRIRSHVGSQLSNYGLSGTVQPHTVDWLGFWMLDNPGSGVATDLSIHGNNGAYPNGATQVAGAGGVGHASLLTAASSTFVDLGNPSLFQLTGSFSLNIWAKFTTVPGAGVSQGIFAKNFASSGSGFILMCPDPAGAPSVVGFANLKSPWFAGNFSSTNPTLVNGTWYMLTLTYDASTGTIAVYVNGAIGTTGTVSPTAITDSGTNLLIGQIQGGSPFATSPNYMNGAVQGAGILNRAMSAAEVLAQVGPGGTVVAP